MNPALVLLAIQAVWAPVRWHSSDPATLDLLRNTPLNCLLLERSHWAPPLIQAARALQIVTLGVIHPGDQLASQVIEAVKLKVDGLVLEGEFDERTRNDLRSSAKGSALSIIELPGRRAIRLDSDDAVIGTWQGLWPGIEIQHGGKALAGPSATPWVFTNAGFLRFLRAASEAEIWVGVAPPPGTIYPVERYEEAVGDAALAGTRWIVALDSDFEKRLYGRERQALADWKELMTAIAFYDRADWADYRPYSHLAVVQDATSGALLSGSLLDMMSSQKTPVRVIPTRRLDASRLTGGLQVLLMIDPDALSPGQMKAVQTFQAAGGQVLYPPAKWRFPPTSPEQILLNRRQLDQMQGLWAVTYQATLRKNFGARTFNTTGMQSSVLRRADGKSIAVHLVNYTEFPVESVTVQALGVWKRARLFTPDGKVRDLPVYPVKEGTGVDIDRMGVIATVVLD